MPDYNNGKIYKIINPQNETIYIGSTIQKLSQRFCKHPHRGRGNKIILIERCPCNSREELVKREQELIEQYDNLLNKFRAYMSEEQHKEYRKKYYKEHYENKKEQKKRNYQNNKEHYDEYFTAPEETFFEELVNRHYSDKLNTISLYVKTIYLEYKNFCENTGIEAMTQKKLCYKLLKKYNSCISKRKSSTIIYQIDVTHEIIVKLLNNTNKINED